MCQAFGCSNKPGKGSKKSFFQIPNQSLRCLRCIHGRLQISTAANFSATDAFSGSRHYQTVAALTPVGVGQPSVGHRRCRGQAIGLLFTLELGITCSSSNSFDLLNLFFIPLWLESISMRNRHYITMNGNTRGKLSPKL